MDECEYCGHREKSVEMKWTENLEDLACKICFNTLHGIKEYANVFGVEYVMSKQYPVKKKF